MTLILHLKVIYILAEVKKDQSHEMHKISLLESYDDRFFTINVSRDHFMPENVFKMKIIQKASLKNQNSKWYQFLKKAQNGHFKGLEGTQNIFMSDFQDKIIYLL